MKNQKTVVKKNSTSFVSHTALELCILYDDHLKLDGHNGVKE